MRQPASEGPPARPPRFTRYPAYRNSGVEWLGEVPAHWEAKRLKRIFRVVNGSTPRSEEPDYWEGDIPWVTPEDLGDLSGTDIQRTKRSITEAGYRSCGTTLVPAGSLVLSTRAPIGYLAVAAADLCTNQGCRSLVFRAQQSRRFFFYQLLAVRPQLEALGQGSTFRELAKDKLEDVFVIEPPVGEQRAIAAFLDRETAKIDALVAEKGRLIELLQEKRTALITRAVTKGLDPSVPMKDSGVQWLGEIPTQWEVKRLKYLVPGVTVGIVVTPAKYYVESGVPCLRSLNVSRGEIDQKDSVFISREANELHRKSKIFEGDVVVVRTGLAGTAAVVPRELDGANCIDLLVIRRSLQLRSRFIFYYLNSATAMSQAELMSVGAIQGHYNTATLANLLVPSIPPLEQDRILSHLDEETRAIDALLAGTHVGVERLKEFRTALISAAVTGEIDVREEVAGGLPP